MENALNTFLQCVEKYRVTPLKSVLTTQLIEKEDTQRLQQVMDASIKVHGEMNSLYDLVFAFLECGRVRQAKKVLEVFVSRFYPCSTFCFKQILPVLIRLLVFERVLNVSKRFVNDMWTRKGLRNWKIL